jgi:hypothetical protein
VYRITEFAQALDVAPDGPGGDVQAFGEIGAGPVPVCLEQRQQSEQPRRGFQHGFENARCLGIDLS